MILIIYFSSRWDLFWIYWEVIGVGGGLGAFYFVFSDAQHGG
jgi:hypothetical protein